MMRVGAGSMRVARVRVRVVLWIAAPLLATNLAPRAAVAQTNYIGPDGGNWSTAANWSAGVPTTGSTAALPATSSSYTVNFDGSYAAATALGTLTIDGGRTARPPFVQFTSTLSQTQAGTSMYATTEHIGDTGLGSAVYNQSAGSNTATQFTLGFAAGANGTYNLSSSASLTLLSGQCYVGDSGTGTFNQSGASTVSTAYLQLAVNAGSSGSYNLSGGSFTTGTGALIVGVQGAGVFVQSGGTVTTDSLDLGLNNNIGSGGTYRLGGTGSLTVTHQEVIGVASHTQDEFDQTGGTNTAGGQILIGAPNAQAVFNLQGGTVKGQSIDIIVGGTLNQTGGTINATTPVQLAGGTITGTLQNLGSFNYHSGTFSGRLVNQGTVTSDAPVLALGNGLENDVPLTVTPTFEIDSNGAGLNNTSTLTLAGGTLAGSGPLVNNNLLSGYGTIGGIGGFVNNSRFTQSGGDFLLRNTGLNFNNGNLALDPQYQFQVAFGLHNTGAINLNGGNLSGNSTLINETGGAILGPGIISTGLANNGTLVAQNGQLQVPAFTNAGSIVLTPGGVLAGGAVDNTGTIQGAGTITDAVTNDTGATIEPVAGVLTFTGALTNPTGTLNAATGNKLFIASGLATNAGTINLSGGIFDNNNHPLNNTGAIIGFGTLRTGGLTNNGNITLSGGSTSIAGDVTNAASHTLTVEYTPTIFTGNVTNNGTIKITKTTVTFAGTFTNNGTYNSDPADSHFQDLSVGPGGTLLGGTGDRFIITGDLINASTNRTGWDTSAAEFDFTGGAMHHLAAGGSDLGPTYGGYGDNFAWGVLSLGAGDSLSLAGGGALYVHEVQLAGGVAQVRQIAGNGSDLYYDPADSANAYLSARTFDLSGGGRLLPVPEPALLAPLALAFLLPRRRSSTSFTKARVPQFCLEASQINQHSRCAPLMPTGAGAGARSFAMSI